MVSCRCRGRCRGDGTPLLPQPCCHLFPPLAATLVASSAGDIRKERRSAGGDTRRRRNIQWPGRTALVPKSRRPPPDDRWWLDYRWGGTWKNAPHPRDAGALDVVRPRLMKETRKTYWLPALAGRHVSVSFVFIVWLALVGITLLWL